ncbi:MAG: hypothetical protein GC199_11195 [Alphaproteobacteria bacterium]|nr:hypothetical protein [Alphaproteobacteria bacterium]
MSQGPSAGGEIIKRHSAWRWPFFISLGVTVLGAGVMAYYFAPAPGDITGTNPKATISTAPVNLTVGGIDFEIPANYTRIPKSRAGGKQEEVALHALLPDLAPATAANEAEFADSSPTARRVMMLIHLNGTPLTERDRFVRVFQNQVVDPEGEDGPYGLTLYTFQPRSGYAGHDLFTGVDARGQLAVIRCAIEAPDLPAPECQRDLDLAPGLSLSYQYKREFLTDWKKIDADIVNLVTGFRSVQLR